MKFLILNFFGLSMLMSSGRCQSEYINDSRIYVEANVTSRSGSVAGIPVELNSEDIVVSKASTDQNGFVKLGGAGTTHSTSLYFGRKILSVSEGTIDYDSLSVILPNKNYVKLSNITLQ